jgi:hypothetical protein
MQHASLIPRIPISAWLWCTGFVLGATCVWSFLFANGLSTDWTLWGFAFLVAVVSVGFGLAVWSLLVLIPGARRPVWLARKQAVVLAALCFVMQSAVAGSLTLLGVWPHGSIWFLGALPFAVGG